MFHKDSRPGHTEDDWVAINSRTISLDGFVRFVYNGNTSIGGLTYERYRNRAKAEPRKISFAGSHPGHLYHPQRKNHCQTGSPYQDRVDTVDALFGSVPDTITLEEARKERLNFL